MNSQSGSENILDPMYMSKLEDWTRVNRFYNSHSVEAFKAAYLDNLPLRMFFVVEEIIDHDTIRRDFGDAVANRYREVSGNCCPQKQTITGLGEYRWAFHKFLLRLEKKIRDPDGSIAMKREERNRIAYDAFREKLREGKSWEVATQETRGMWQ